MNPWWRTRTGAPQPIRLVCLPHAGGSAASFREWGPLLEGRCELRALELPGRGRRIGEPLVSDMGEAVAMLADEVADACDRPCCVFGYSVGALVAFELAREWRRRGLPQPVRLIVAASAAPRRARPGRGLHALPDRELVERLARWGGVPAALRDQEQLLRLVLPGLRADLRLSEAYSYRTEEPLSCPIVAYAGSRDPIASADLMSEWRAHTTGSFEMHTVPGGHFFLEESRVALLTSLATELASASELSDVDRKLP